MALSAKDFGARETVRTWHDRFHADGVWSDPVAEQGWKPVRANVDGIYTGERMSQAAARHNLEIQVTTRSAAKDGFAPLPLRWRVEATFGTQTNRCRQLIHNLEQSATVAENAVKIANVNRVSRACCRDESAPL